MQQEQANPIVNGDDGELSSAELSSSYNAEPGGLFGVVGLAHLI